MFGFREHVLNSVWIFIALVAICNYVFVAEIISKISLFLNLVIFMCIDYCLHITDIQCY